MIMNKKDLKKFMENVSNITPTSINAHYGMSDYDFTKVIARFLFEFNVKNQINEIIDTEFKNLSADDRLKVHAYAIAYAKNRILNNYEGEWV